MKTAHDCSVGEPAAETIHQQRLGQLCEELSRPLRHDLRGAGSLGVVKVHGEDHEETPERRAGRCVGIDLADFLEDREIVDEVQTFDQAFHHFVAEPIVIERNPQEVYAHHPDLVVGADGVADLNVRYVDPLEVVSKVLG
jgi:hypothetical protein